MPNNDNNDGTYLISPPKPMFYETYDTPLSTKKERKRIIPRSAPRLVRTAPASNRFCPYRFYIDKPQFISFKARPDTPSVRGSRSYNDQSPETFFEQCFEGQRKIGEGSFGEVFSVKSKDDGRWYAVKRTIEAFRSASDRALKLREVQKHELLPKHPNLLDFVRAWEEKGRLYIQTELCEYSLSDYCEREHNIPEEQLWFFFSDLISAVNHLHQHDLLHLDIKPANIFVTRDRVCKLGDFGLIFDLNRDGHITPQEGDSKYLAPEALNECISKPSDIFSLGITLLELATDLDLPSRGEGWHQLRESNIPDKFTNRLSPQLRHLIFWMMDPNPEKRPTAEQLMSDSLLREYAALRYSHRARRFMASIGEYLWLFCLWIVSVLRLVVYPIRWTVSSVSNRIPKTPDNRISIERDESTEESEISLELDHSPVFCGRAPMTMPPRVMMRSPLRSRPIRRFNLDVLDSPEKENPPRPSRRSNTALRSPRAGRGVGDRGSSADELSP